jgi:aconitate hydratase
MKPIGKTTPRPASRSILRDIWPTQKEVNDTVESPVSRPDMFRKEYANVGQGNDQWNAFPSKAANCSPGTRSQHLYPGAPLLHQSVARRPKPIKPITAARVLVMVGDSVTTDHISPAGSIKKDGPAGKFLMEHGVVPPSISTATAPAAATTAS